MGANVPLSWVIGLDTNHFVIVRRHARLFDTEVFVSQDVLDNPKVIVLDEPPLHRDQD